MVSYRFKPVKSLVCASLALLSCTSAFAYEGVATSPQSVAQIQVGQSAPQSMAQVPQAILNLDLCTLAYQLYHQSLCLSLDPWYDVFARVGSDRRDNICKYTHEYAALLGNGALTKSASNQGFYSGPNSARGWSGTNYNLDPIITNYKYMDAKIPTFNRDGERFLAVQAPTYLTRGLKTIDGMRYKSKPTGYPNYDVEKFGIRDYGGGDDHLIVFEGGTGIAGKTEPSWSPMGFVLMHKTVTGYDAHIVFRGSRSGAALSKTVWKAQAVIGEPKGNPDWITDLRSSSQIEQPLISKVGTVTEGFAEALPTMLGPIAACCKYLEQTYPAPEHIYVTGHSLGAGLASQFASAVLQGTYGDQIRQDVKSWPWQKINLMAYAQPIPGNAAWASEMDKIALTAEHYWVDGDSVVEATSNKLVGLFIKGEHCGRQIKLASVADCKDNPHEVFVIRAALLREMMADNAALSQQLASDNTWGYYGSLAKMLTGQQQSYLYPSAPAAKIVTEQNLRDVLQTGNFGAEYSNWLDQVYARMIADKSSYIGFKLQGTLDDRRKLVQAIAAQIKSPALAGSTQELSELAKAFTALDGNLGLTNEEQWVYCGLILSRLQKAPLTVSDLMAQPTTKGSLESKFE